MRFLCYKNTKKLLVSGMFSMLLFVGSSPLVSGESNPIVVPRSIYEIQDDFRNVAKRVLPSVVEILTTSAEQPVPQFPFPDFPFGFETDPDQKAPQQKQKVQGLGSGVLIRRDGDKVYILTNNHVIDKAETIQVTTNGGRKFKAKLVGADPRRDLALISISTSSQDLVLASLADSNELQVGDLVMAIGNPLGLDFTVTHGIVSALGRHGGPDGSNFDSYIQTDAPINRGNSGGALVNLRGEVVGINTWIASPNGANVGLGFAIPINTAKKAIDDLLLHGAVRYGWLGAEVSGITEDDAKNLDLPTSQGAFISNVFTDSPADKAGVLPGDVVVKINGQDVKDAATLVQIVGDLPVGKTAEFQILRRGQTVTKTVDIRQRGKESELSHLRSWPGLTVVPLTPDIRDQLSLDKDVRGLAVTEVDAHSTAEIAGLEAQDVITKINDEPVRTEADFYRLFNAKPSDVKIGFVRQGVELSIGISR